MRSNVFLAMVILVLLISLPPGVIAGESATEDLHPSVLLDSQPAGLTTGENMLLPNLPETRDIITAYTSTGSVTVTKTKGQFVDQLLLGNEDFRRDVFNTDPERYQTLALGQSPGILWIGCSDSRSDPERITSSQPGELFVTRNIGNIVPNQDWSLAAVAEYAINYLKVKEIVVVGHSDCGAIKAMDADLQDPYLTPWLNDAREAKARVDARISKPETPEEEKERTHQIELENVRLQIEHLMTYPSVRLALDEGRIEVHGLYYDLKTGRLSQVI